MNATPLEALSLAIVQTAITEALLFVEAGEGERLDVVAALDDAFERVTAIIEGSLTEAKP